MILSFTQEEKKYIESQGMMVIEFKRRIHKTTFNVWENIWRVLKEWINKVHGIINVLVHATWDFSKRVAELSEHVKKLVEKHVPSSHIEKHKPVFKYMKCNKPYTGVRRIDIRCRSRC